MKIMTNSILEFNITAPNYNTTYTTGDTIGNNFMSITSNQFAHGNSKLLQSVAVRDAAHVNMAMDLLLFHKAPVHTTTTDNGRLQINALDINCLLNKISIASSDYVDFNGSSLATKNSLAIPVIQSTNAEMYGLLVARGAQAYSSTGDISLALTFA